MDIKNRKKEEMANDSREIVLIAVKQNGLAIQYASDRLKADSEIAIAAMSENLEAFDYIAPELKNSVSFLNKCYSEIGAEVFQLLSNDVRTDKSVLKEFIYMGCIDALIAFSDEFQGDKEVLALIADCLDVAAYGIHGEKLAVRLPKYLRDNPDFIKYIMGNYNPYLIDAASNELLKNRQFIKDILSDGYSEYWYDEDPSEILTHFPDEIRDDEEIVSIAITHYDWRNYELASDRVRAIPSIVRTAVDTDIDALSVITDRSLLLELIKDESFTAT